MANQLDSVLLVGTYKGKAAAAQFIRQECGDWKCDIRVGTVEKQKIFVSYIGFKPCWQVALGVMNTMDIKSKRETKPRPKPTEVDTSHLLKFPSGYR